VSGQAASHRQGGRCFAPTALGLLDFVAASHNSLRA